MVFWRGMSMVNLYSIFNHLKVLKYFYMSHFTSTIISLWNQWHEFTFPYSLLFLSNVHLLFKSNLNFLWITISEPNILTIVLNFEPYEILVSMTLGFPCGSAGKESSCNSGDLDSIPEGKGYPLQYSGLENSMDSPWGHKESDTTEWLSLSWLFESLCNHVCLYH